MEELVLTLKLIGRLLITAFGCYLILWAATNRRLPSPGRVIGLTLRALVRGCWWLLVNIGTVIGDAVLALSGTKTHRATRTTSRNLDGAHFLSFFPRWRLLRRGLDGLVIDGRRRISLEASFRNLSLIAPTGGGKSTSFVIPNLLRARRGSSYVVLDPSGEIYEKTSGHLASRGFNIRVFNVSDRERTLTYNPLARIETASQASELAVILTTNAFGRSKGDNEFWNRSAATLISVLIRCLLCAPEPYRHLAQVNRLLADFGPRPKRLNFFVSKYADEQTFSDYKGLLSSSERVIEGIGATARAALKAFGDPDLALITATDTLQFETTFTTPTALFVQVPEHRIRHYSFLPAIFWQQFFAACMEADEEARIPVFALLDEAGNFKIPGLEEIITTARKRQMSISLLLQDIEQLTALYGGDGASVILNGGTASRVFLPGLSPSTTKEISSLLGWQSVEEGSRRDRRPLLSPDAVRTLDDDEGIYVYANRRPIRLCIRPYFKSMILRRRSRIPAVSLSGYESAPDAAYMTLDTVAHTDIQEGVLQEPAETLPPPDTNSTEKAARRHENESNEEIGHAPAAPAPTPSVPPWAGKLLEETGKTRKEIMALKEALRDKGSTTKTPTTAQRADIPSDLMGGKGMATLTPGEIRKLITKASETGASQSLEHVARNIEAARDGAHGERDILSTAECMELLQITSRTTYYARCKEGLPYHQIGKKRYHLREEVVTWMQGTSPNTSDK